MVGSWHLFFFSTSVEALTSVSILYKTVSLDAALASSASTISEGALVQGEVGGYSAVSQVGLPCYRISQPTVETRWYIYLVVQYSQCHHFLGMLGYCFDSSCVSRAVVDLKPLQMK